MGELVEVRVPAESVTTSNRQARVARRRVCSLAPPPQNDRASRVDPPPARAQVRARQLFGTDVYTEDSDVVAALAHAGFYELASAPPAGLAELRVTLRPLPAQPGYAACARHGIRSRSWGGSARPGAPPPGAYRVERAYAVMLGGATAQLAPLPQLAAPTFALAAAERAAQQPARGAQRRGAPEVTLQYSLCNEPYLKYTASQGEREMGRWGWQRQPRPRLPSLAPHALSHTPPRSQLSAVADRGLKRSGWTSTRLRSEVLFVETLRERFELSWDDSGPGGDAADAYRFARCNQLMTTSGLRAAGLPLAEGAVTVLARGLGWEQVAWGPAGVTIEGVAYPLLRCVFLPRGQTAA